MPFPIHPPKQMPCPHWQHFPISPVDTKANPFDSMGGAAAAANGSAAVNKPPEPVSYRYCLQCKASGKEGGNSSDRD
ncbi:GL15937 [Drosophila persimilis]|uniref:Uncharacterized protein n=2 Tax=pseudoobscura subgroup TaxID=32358 RepID=A0A6I8UA79_DROPS|nr:uncharacterized protein LOC4811662 [Drosophila pseudoobscura]XP_017156664.1 uncharacterized protein LOC108165117 [Drosophila miranda]XP_026847105.1 uncharacterized protein LOC6599315 [Drosophila persimilis]EDW29999.1 GL15937 [Drosophila persimilis]